MIPKEHIFMNVSLKNDKFIVCLVIVSTVCSGIIPAVTSILTGKVFNLLEHSSLDYSVPNDLIIKSMSIMILGAVSFPVIWILISSWMLIAERQCIRLRYQLLYTYISKSFQWYDSNSVNLLGEFTQLNRCIEEIRQGSSESAAILFQSLITVCTLIGTSFYYSWSMTLVILCSSPLIIIITLFLSKLINKSIDLENQETSKAAELLVWSMNSVSLVKFSNTQDIEIRKFNKLVKKCNSIFIRICLLNSLNYSLIRMLSLLMFIQGFWYGCTMIKRGKLQIDNVIICFHSCLMLASTFNELFHQLIILQKGHVANIKINKFLNSFDPGLIFSINIKNDMQKSLIIPPKPLICDNSFGITFHNVSFKYPTRPHVPVLSNVNINFRMNELTFIIGKSGSGKSTLPKLLLKFFSGFEGEIKINGVPIDQIDQEWIIDNVTVVEQRCRLFNDTLKNNILLAYPGLDEQNDPSTSGAIQDRLMEACSFAELDNVISQLPNGLNTKIGVDGVNLSGGQSQKVALSRMYIRDTPVLILDESVSAIDIISRQILMDNIREWRKGKTTIILTHELDQIKANDFLYVMENGKVVDSGYKSTLLNTEGSKFKKFYEIQKMDRSEEGSTGSIIDSYDCGSEAYKNEKRTCLNQTAIIYDNWENPTKILEGETQKNLINDVVYEEDVSCDSIDYSINDVQYKKDGSKNDLDREMSFIDIIKHMLRDSDKKLLLIFGILCSLLAGVSNPIFSFGFSYLLNGIVLSETHESTSHYLLKWSLILIAISIADSIFNFLRSFILAYCSEIWILNLRELTMRVIQYNKFEWFKKDQNRSSELSAVLLNDLRDLRNLISEFLSTFIIFVVVSFCGLIWAIVVGWKLSLVCISMFPILVLFSVLYGFILQKVETSYKTEITRLENCFFEIIVGIKTIKYLHVQDHFIKKYAKLIQNIKKVAMKRALVTGIGISFSHTLTLCIQAVLYYYGLKLVFVGEYTSKRMFETLTLVLFTIVTCSNLTNQIPEVARGKRTAVWTYRIIDERASTTEQMDFQGRYAPIFVQKKNQQLIKIHNLTFAYPNIKSKKVYSNLNMELYSDQTVALVGASGSGKSTLISLVTRLYSPDCDCIFVDGTDVHKWDLRTLRQQIGIVEQTPMLFNGTIKDNLLYGIEQQITEKDIMKVLKTVNIYDFILSLPYGLDTYINTDLLSGGQLQRLCIARVLLTKKRILIFDECTSALDAESAKVIHDIVAIGIPQTLIISITHDLQMMQVCKKILVLKDGVIVQEGSYEDLICVEGEFKRIVTW